MPSQKQITANRQNAQKSTGPKSATGKAVVALNALQHGVLSQHVCLPEEDESALIALGKKLRHHLQPVGELEVVLVDRIMVSLWRLRRVLAMETSLIQYYRDPDRTSWRAKTLGELPLQDQGDRFGRLLRYETTFERSLYKALHELQRLQAARAGEGVPLPAVGELDVFVSFNVRSWVAIPRSTVSSHMTASARPSRNASKAFVKLSRAMTLVSLKQFFIHRS